jgi:hypothetical protein
MTHPADIALLRYADGEHSKDTAEHLASCTTCRSVVQDSRQVSAALRALTAPPPPQWLGYVAPVHRPRWHAIAAMFVAGILVGGTATHVGESDVSFAGLVPTADRPMRSTAPHPIGPGRWTYLRRDYVDSVLWANPRLETVTVDSSPTDWIVVTTTPEGERDSLRVSRRDLVPQSGTWRRRDGKVHAAVQFRRDSTIDSIWGYSRSWRRALPVGDSTRVRIAHQAELRVYFRTVLLDRHWHGSARMLGWYWGVDSARTGDLAVIGRHRIATPVGQCDCWQVAMSIHGRQTLFWIRAEDGVVVKTEDSYGVAELVAEDPLPS